MMDEKIFDFAYRMAFRDATLRKAFPKGDGEEKQAFDQRKEMVFVNSKEKVRKYLEEIFRGNAAGPLDVICSLCDDENKFTFGNAQKLVNMIAKYMYIATYYDESKRELFSNCHCPMDGRMIDCINKLFPQNKIPRKWSTLKYDGVSVPNDYVVFQNRVKTAAGKDNIHPIEFDYMNW